jgi:hypothetical protein
MQHKESFLQKNCVRWLRLQHKDIITIPANADYKFAGTDTQRAIIGKRMNELGYRRGTADLYIAKANGEFHGLFVEFKADNGRQTQEQKDFEAMVTAEGYLYVVCRSVVYFIETVNNYLK